MADRSDLVAAMIEALKDPSVVGTLMHELREEIKKGFKDELKQMEKGIEDRDKKINELSNRIEELEQYGRRNGVRIHGIKEQKGENTDQIMLDLAKSIGADIPKTAFGRSHRVGPDGGSKPRPIIAKFIGHNNKVELLKHKKNLRTIGEMDSEGKPKHPIFINEDLTKTRVNWAQRARTMKKAGKITDTWTRNGIIFIKWKEGKGKDGKDIFHVERVDNKESLRDIERQFELKMTIPKQAF